MLRSGNMKFFCLYTIQSLFVSLYNYTGYYGLVCLCDYCFPLSVFPDSGNLFPMSYPTVLSWLLLECLITGKSSLPLWLSC